MKKIARQKGSEFFAENNKTSVSCNAHSNAHTQTPIQYIHKKIDSIPEVNVTVQALVTIMNHTPTLSLLVQCQS